MFCEYCGNKIDSSHKFCTSCGHSIQNTAKAFTDGEQPLILEEKWWHRLFRVLYVIVYLPLLFIIPLVWSENIESYYGEKSYGDSFLYSLITLIIYMTVVRLIKIAVLYVAVGRKPRWRREFKKLF